jgi:hypothetical protein
MITLESAAKFFDSISSGGPDRRWLRAPENRAIAVALTLSLAVHLALFLIARTPALSIDRVSAFPDLRLWIQQPSDRQIAADAVADVRRSQTLAPILDEIVAAPGPPAPLSAASHETQSPIAAPDLQTAADPTAMTSDALQVITTPPEVASSVPIGAAISVPGTQRPEMSEDEQSTLAKRIASWSQSFRVLDPQNPELSWTDGDRRYAARIVRRSAPDSTAIEHVFVEITTDVEGQALKSTMNLRRLAFSHFAQLIDRWNTTVQLHDDEIDGRFHSNSQLFVGWDARIAPRFFGQVTTAANGISTGDTVGVRSRWDLFGHGVATRVQRIRLPRVVAPVAGDVATSDMQVRRFGWDTRLMFYPDGSYGWRPASGAQTETRMPMPTGPLALTSSRNTTLYVQGVVHGKVLVYSPEQIVVTGSIRYADNPRLRDSADYLGLVSEKNIEVDEPQVTGPGNLEIDAAVFARRDELGSPALLTIHGSLSAGTMEATEPRYATKIEFDQRFEHTRPPGFPSTDSYEIDDWDARWTPVENQ